MRVRWVCRFAFSLALRQSQHHRRRRGMRRSMGSNVVGAAVDSLIFPTLAFGALMPAIVLMQFAAKAAGGAMWAALMNRFVKQEQP